MVASARPGSRSGVVNDRKVFSVIVDASSLISGIKRNTRDGIKKWVNNGAIRLLVPLHTLQQLNVISTTRTDRFGAEAKETLLWLDQVTSDTFVVDNGVVQLQESYEAYDTWAEVEQFLLPQTLLSHESGTSDDGNVHASIDALRLDGNADLASVSSKESPEMRPITPQSPESAYSTTSLGAVQPGSPYKHDKIVEDSPGSVRRHKKNNSLAASDYSINSSSEENRIPKSLQPLYNHILWRVHHSQHVDVDQGLGAYILLTNDPLKSSIARRFGIRVKRIEQLRDIIAREDREVKNRLNVLKREGGAGIDSANDPKLNAEASSQRPHSRGSSLRTSPKPPRVLDPDTFGRTSDCEEVMDPQDQFLPVDTPVGPAKPSLPTRGRGSRGGHALGRGLNIMSVAPKQPRNMTEQESNKPIDPDSFDRPRPERGRRGGRRQIWNPS